MWSTQSFWQIICTHPPEYRIRPSAVAWRTASARCFVASSCVSRGPRAPQVYTAATRRHGVVLLTADTAQRARMARKALRDVRDKKTRAAALPGTSAAHASRGRRRRAARVTNGVRVIDCSNNPLRSSRRRMQGPRKRLQKYYSLSARTRKQGARGDGGRIEVYGRCSLFILLYLFVFFFTPVASRLTKVQGWRGNMQTLRPRSRCVNAGRMRHDVAGQQPTTTTK